MNIDQSIKVAVDAIVFGYRENKLFVLLINQKFGSEKGQWALPGGFVKNNESLEAAVTRELEEEAGVVVNILEQLYSFGDVDRDPRFRVVSVAYFGTVNPDQLNIKAGSDAEKAEWFPIDDMPDLAFDHDLIISKALMRLKAKLNYQPIGFELLSQSFPFSDLENLYTTILDKEIDRRNFRKKIMSFGLLVETDEYRKVRSGRPAKLFQFDKKKYRELLKKGMTFEIKFA